MKAKYGHPALLLVICQDKATAEWAAGPFKLGPEGWKALAVHPLVLGPGNVPPIIDAEEAAQNLAMATFSAMTHGRSQDAPAILDALARALGTADEESVAYYSELLEIGLGETPARETWRNLMTIRTYFPGRGTLIEETLLKGEAKGEAKGRADMVLRALEHRGVPVSARDRERIAECTDLDIVQGWADRAFTVSSVDELFGEES
ncbi:hypothetical protein [Streptomyces telluris]|uniref:DUF4351 domain-containing protein n=1 Tax=Streptomyces telluris TaxID=2720021 RepID=A0A9X2LES5_9ACTN|nr:hypothetical protein [Streptomyces telluris]MCQ8769881.1 hypothetical protein [Streptomyces telluris]NJP77753.1 hypothetical protein [Streptomyces telluris]